MLKSSKLQIYPTFLVLRLDFRHTQNLPFSKELRKFTHEHTHMHASTHIYTFCTHTLHPNRGMSFVESHNAKVPLTMHFISHRQTILHFQEIFSFTCLFVTLAV